MTNDIKSAKILKVCAEDLAVTVEVVLMDKPDFGQLEENCRTAGIRSMKIGDDCFIVRCNPEVLQIYKSAQCLVSRSSSLIGACQAIQSVIQAPTN